MASKWIVRASALAVMAALAAGAYWHQTRPTSQETTVAGAPAGGPTPGGAAGGARGGGKPAVEVATVETTRLVDEAQAVGSLRSRQGVVIKPEVGGRITQINFRDGERVRKGQLLVQLDDQLQAAQIKQAEAELSIARANFNRNRELVEQNFISRRTLDESAANLEVAEARLALALATAARLRIVAPFDGMVGMRQVNIGDYLKDGAEVVNLEDMDALYVDYRLPERFQAKVRRGQMAQVDIDALPGRKFPARVQAIDPLIDANGRSLGVRACIDNRRLQLRPGMFARVSTVFGVREDAKLVPEEAIVPQGGRQFVIRLIDGPDGKVSQRTEVRLGLRSPGKVEVLEGLDAADTVVVAGQQRLQKDGTAVRVIELGARAGGQGGPAGPGGPGGAAAAAAAAAAPSAMAPQAAAAGGGAGSGPGAAPAPAASGVSSQAQAGMPPLHGPDPCLAGMGPGRGEDRADGPKRRSDQPRKPGPGLVPS